MMIEYAPAVRTEQRRETHRTGATNQRHVAQARSTAASGTESGSNGAPSSNERVRGNL